MRVGNLAERPMPPWDTPDDERFARLRDVVRSVVHPPIMPPPPEVGTLMEGEGDGDDVSTEGEYAPVVPLDPVASIAGVHRGVEGEHPVYRFAFEPLFPPILTPAQRRDLVRTSQIVWDGDQQFIETFGLWWHTHMDASELVYEPPVHYNNRETIVMPKSIEEFFSAVMHTYEGFWQKFLAWRDMGRRLPYLLCLTQDEWRNIARCCNGRPNMLYCWFSDRHLYYMHADELAFLAGELVQRRKALCPCHKCWCEYGGSSVPDFVASVKPED